MDTLGISRFVWALIVAILLLQVIIGVCILLFFTMIAGLQLQDYTPHWIIRIWHRGCKIMVVVFIILFSFSLYIMIELIFKKHEFSALPFYLPVELNQLLPESIKFLKITFTKKGLVFYFLTLVLYPISVYLLFMDKDRWIDWYLYFGGYVVIVWILFIVMFTDNFLIACSGHILICCISFFVIYFVLWRYSKVRVPVIIWVFFFGGVLLIISGACGLYFLTGSFTWSITQGVSLEGVVGVLVQYCFYFGVLLPVGLFPACYLTLGNCKALPTSFRIFFNTVFLLQCFFMITLIFNLLGCIVFKYLFVSIIYVTIIILIIYLYFETTFSGIISLGATLHFYLFLLISIFDPSILHNGLVFHIWVQLLYVSGNIIILAKYSRCYEKCVTIFKNGVFYKYPGTVCINMAVILFVSVCLGSFFYEVYWNFTCVSGDIIAFTILNFLVANFVIVWGLILWRWLNFWFTVPKVPDTHTPKRFTWVEAIGLVYLLLIAIGSVFFPWIFYW